MLCHCVCMWRVFANPVKYPTLCGELVVWSGGCGETYLVAGPGYYGGYLKLSPFLTTPPTSHPQTLLCTICVHSKVAKSKQSNLLLVIYLSTHSYIVNSHISSATLTNSFTH